MSKTPITPAAGTLIPRPAPRTPKAEGLPVPQEILTRKQAAAWLGVSASSLAQWAAKGEGPAMLQLSRRRLAYRLEDLRAFAAARVVSKEG